MATQVDQRINQLEEENKRLRSAVEELSILNEVASAVTSTWSLNKIVDLIVEKCVKHLNVEQGSVSLFEKKEDADALRTMVRRVDSNLDSSPFRLGNQISGWMLKHHSPLRINNLSDDGRFRVTSQADKSIRSLMCVPLRLKGRLIGVLSVFNKRGGEEFTESDQRLLTIIAAQSTQVIENARLYEEEKELQGIQKEMEVARSIQAKLLPKTPPSVPGYDIAGQSISAQNVGGDYYDFLPSQDERLAVCLGDVAGKGMPAALVMANLQATIRGQNLLGESAAKCLQRSNCLLHASTDSEKFVTLFYGVLDTKTRELQYSNAGHNPPVVLSEGKGPQRLDTGGPVLGIMPDFEYQEATVVLHPGDLLLIFSDGFSEAMNLRQEEFGEQRLIELASRYRHQRAENLIQEICQHVEQHTGEAPQTDDMTIVVVRVES